MKFWSGYIPKLPTLTRFELPDGQRLAYMKYGSGWRIVHIDPNSKRTHGLPVFVGAIYKTKAELLADLDSFAHSFGF